METFNVKVTSKNSAFDDNFNRVLPKEIFESWLMFETNEKAEQDYIKAKKQVMTESKVGAKINESFKGLKEVRFYKNSTWKKVFIVHNNAKYLFAGKIKYFNFDLLTKEIFDKNNEIYLSFVE